MKLKFFGAAQTVTGSRTQFEHYHYKGLVDCGLFQGPRELRDLNWNPQPELLESKCVILTHAHIDHSGFLPRLYKLGYRNPVYCSHATRDLLKVMLLDSAKLQEEDAKYANDSRYSHHQPARPLYDSKDVLGCLELVESVDWEKWTPLSPHISFKLVRSGHILGGSYVQLSYSTGQQSKILTFTGDIGTNRSQVLRDPDFISETNALVIESTYGNRAIKPENTEHKLAEIVNRVISRGGTLVIPAFAVGRTQDLLLIFKRLKKQLLIPDVPIYLDSPMAHQITQAYLNHSEELKGFGHIDEIYEALHEATFRPVLSPDESMLLCMSTEPKIVISASGMLQGGRILHHLKAKLPDPLSGVLFVGFQAHGTKGRLLKDGLNKIRIHHRTIDVEAEVFSLEGMSAHADANELLAWMKQLRTPPECAMINHGELEASQALKFTIDTELNWQNVLIPAPGAEIKLSD